MSLLDRDFELERLIPYKPPEGDCSGGLLHSNRNCKCYEAEVAAVENRGLIGWLFG